MNGVEVRRRESYELERSLVLLLRSFVNFVTQGYKGTVGSSREFRHLMTKEVYEEVID